MNSPLLQLLVRWAVLALGVTLATKIVPGISCSDGMTLVAVVLLLSLFNAILRPLLVLFTLPFIVITMGLGVVVINAFLFLLVGALVNGFYVDTFWAALGGAIVVGVTNFILNVLMGGGRRPPPGPSSRPPPSSRAKRDDVIDI